jgi:hypothetical protein
MGPLLPHLQMVLLVTYALREHGVPLESLPLHCVLSANITLIKALIPQLYVKSVLLELTAGTIFPAPAACPAGNVCSGASITPCIAGTYCPAGTLTMLKCPAGTFQSGTG